MWQLRDGYVTAVMTITWWLCDGYDSYVTVMTWTQDLGTHSYKFRVLSLSYPVFRQDLMPVVCVKCTEEDHDGPSF